MQVYMASMYENQYKLLARSGNKVQEVNIQKHYSFAIARKSLKFLWSLGFESQLYKGIAYRTLDLYTGLWAL